VEHTEAKISLPQGENLSRREIAQIIFQERYLATFQERLPRYPYATDDPRQGMRPRRKEKALEHLYIQVGRYPHAIFRIVLDLDEPTWWDAMDPIPPTLIVPNPREPWKAHIIYELDPPIWLASPGERDSEANPFALVREVDALLRAYFGADPAYNGLLGRNPLAHPHLIGGGKLWDLLSLLEELRELVPRRRALAYLDTATYGRNCELFERVRPFAYSVVAMYRGRENGFALFRRAVAYEAHRLNQELFRDHPQGPLPRKEVEATVIKSVSKWTFDRYRGTRIWPVSGTGRPDRSQLSPAARALIPPLRGEEAEAARRMGLEVANRKRHSKTEEALLEALRRLQARGERVTPTALARESGVHRVTASRWLKRMRGSS
jgi:Primase C terminal 1 (PriCT-1)./Replicase family.